MKPESRDALLTAIAKARSWIDDIRLGRLASFPEIAELESQCERHIRLLAPLAFSSPWIIAAIADGTAPADLTVTGLAKVLPHSWAEQEKHIGLVRCDSKAWTASAVGSLPNRSLAHLEPVSGAPKRKLENAQRRQPLYRRPSAS